MDEELVYDAIKVTNSVNPEIIKFYIEKHFEISLDFNYIQGLINSEAEDLFLQYQHQNLI